MHRDLKPENLLVSADDTLKVCDFGGSVEHILGDTTERKTFCGTYEYMSPEMVQHVPHGHQIDVWALGILLYELVHNREPFSIMNTRSARPNTKAILEGEIKFKQNLSEQYKDLVKRLLNRDPKKRIPLIKVFMHPWVRHIAALEGVVH